MSNEGVFDNAPVDVPRILAETFHFSGEPQQLGLCCFQSKTGLFESPFLANLERWAKAQLAYEFP